MIAGVSRSVCTRGPPLSFSQARRPGQSPEGTASAASSRTLVLAFWESVGWVGRWGRLIGRVPSSSSVHVSPTRLALWWERLVEGGIVTRVVLARWWCWLGLLRTPVGVPVRSPRVPVWSHWCSTPTILVLEVGRIICRVNSIGRSSLVIGNRTPVRGRWLGIVHCHVLLVIRCSLWVTRHGIECRVLLTTTLIMLTLIMM